MLLHLMTWLKSNNIYKPIQVLLFLLVLLNNMDTTGLIGTDAICAEAIAKGVGEQTQTLVGPTINVGMALTSYSLSWEHEFTSEYPYPSHH